VSTAVSPFDRAGAREQKRQRTRRRLYEEAVAEFSRVGFGAASVAEIARAAGVSRPAFYFHFPTKEHVLLEMQWHKELELVDALDGCDTLADTLITLADAIVTGTESVEGPGVARDMMSIYARRPEWLPLDEQPFPLARLVERRFAEGAARGELREGLDPETAPLLALTGMFGYLIAAPESSNRRADLCAMLSLYLRNAPAAR
jgi:AcrR family transcriptional regulator